MQGLGDRSQRLHLFHHPGAGLGEDLRRDRRAGWKTHPDYAKPPARLPRLNEIFARIEQWTMTKTKFEAMDILNKDDIPCGPILSMKELAEDQSLRATGTVVEVDHPERGKYLSVGNPIKLSDSPTEVTRSPLLGEHTDEILSCGQVLGFSTLGTVYFDRLFPQGVDAMMESVDLVKAGKAPRIKQDESKATYEGRCGPDNAKIDWGKPWEQIDRLIRGCNPAPGAWTMLDGNKVVKIFDAKPLPAKDPKGIAGKLGEIVAVEADGFTVVCADGRFKVTRVQPADGKKIDAGEFATTAKLAVGAKFA
jgi:hypothetical protein